MLRIVSTEPMTDSECRTLAPAVARRLATSLAGRARALYELASGAAGADDGGGIPLNPQGRLGVDRSGPPWGDAHTHPLWSTEFLETTAGVAGDPCYLASLTVQNQVYQVPTSLYVRPFRDYEGAPYSRGEVQIVLERIGGAGTATVQVRVHAEGERYRGTTRSVSVTGLVVLTTAPFATLSPAQVQSLRVEVELTTTVGMNVVGASISQTARRRH
jgi:hypothetical protein